MSTLDILYILCTYRYTQHAIVTGSATDIETKVNINTPVLTEESSQIKLYILPLRLFKNRNRVCAFNPNIFIALKQ